MGAGVKANSMCDIKEKEMQLLHFKSKISSILPERDILKLDHLCKLG